MVHNMNARKLKLIKNSVSVTIISYNGSALVQTHRNLVEEKTFRLMVNGAYIENMTCSPWEIREAVTGYLFLKEFISSADDVKELRINENGNEIWSMVDKQILTKTYHIEPIPQRLTSDLRLSVKEVLRLSTKLEESSGLFSRTGGVHCAAMAKHGSFLSYKEDVSRHVAVDKVIGDCLIRNISTKHGILVFSGRVPADILHKVASMGCPVIIAKSAPTEHACFQAKQLGITLIGFARGNKFNIYSNPERITEP